MRTARGRPCSSRAASASRPFAQSSWTWRLGRYDADITLLYANSTPEIPFQRLFDDLAGRQPRLKVVYAVSRPDPRLARSGRADRRGVHPGARAARVHAAFYVSGPKAMVEATAETLRAVGVADEQIKQDFFRATSREPGSVGASGALSHGAERRSCNAST